jgi:hypothetical protein
VRELGLHRFGVQRLLAAGGDVADKVCPWVVHKSTTLFFRTKFILLPSSITYV